jgi:hypothetical protein
MSPIYWSWHNLGGSLKRIWQNLTRCWNDSDTWGLDNTFAQFVLPRLRRFKELNNGVPGNFEINKLNGGDFEEQKKEWDAILDKIVEAFDRVVNAEKYVENPSNFPGWPGGKFDINKTSPELEQWLVRYKALQEENEAKIKEGLELFTKYYRGFWW